MRSFELALATFFVGALFLIAARTIGILNFDVCWAGTDPATYVLVPCTSAFQIKKQVGFGLALNWSVGLCILFPFFVFCTCETVRNGIAAIREMVTRKMFVYEANWSIPAAEVIEGMIRRRQVIIGISIAGIVATLATVFLLTDFAGTVDEFYSRRDAISHTVLSDPEREADWSVAAPICAYTSESSDQCEQLAGRNAINETFAAVAYLYLPFSGAIVAIGFMVGFGLFSRFVFAADLRAAGIMVIPDVNSKDTRRGFEVLEPMFLFAVIGCFVLFAMGYLVTLQNVYLRRPEANIFLFVRPFIPSKFEISADTFVAVLKDSFNLMLINGNSMAVTIIGALFFGIVFLTVAAVLGREAKAGQERLSTELAKKPLRPEFEAYLKPTSVKHAKESLAEAVSWPLRWPSVNVVISWLLLGVVSLFFVQVGFYLVTGGLVYVARQAFSKK